jgi:hypothetical protein
MAMEVNPRTFKSLPGHVIKGIIHKRNPEVIINTSVVTLDKLFL